MFINIDITIISNLMVIKHIIHITSTDSNSKSTPFVRDRGYLPRSEHFLNTDKAELIPNNINLLTNIKFDFWGWGLSVLLFSLLVYTSNYIYIYISLYIYIYAYINRNTNHI